MREYKAEIKRKLTDYLVSEMNLRADEMGIMGIMGVETGSTAVPGVTNVNPTLYAWVGDRRLSQSFFDAYSCRVGIFFGCGTPQEGEQMADIWEDIVEDIFRKDRSLGDSALTWTGEPEVSSGGEPGMAFVICSFDIEYDLGGHGE